MIIVAQYHGNVLTSRAFGSLREKYPKNLPLIDGVFPLRGVHAAPLFKGSDRGLSLNLVEVRETLRDLNPPLPAGLIAFQGKEAVPQAAQGRVSHDEGSQGDERLPPAGGWEPSRAGRRGYAGGRRLLVGVVYGREGIRQPAFRRGFGPGRPAGTAIENVRSGA